MTLSPELAAPLLTDADVHERVERLIGPASQDRCVWLLLVDGDRRQAPTVMPIEDCPRRPDPDMVGGLSEVLGGLLDMLGTDAGPGSCLFVLERFGPSAVRADDEEWASALDGAATGAGLGMLGVFLSTRSGVRRVR